MNDDLISRSAVVSMIEEKQKELCPLGLFSRHAVYGADREKFDAWDEIIEQIERIPAEDVFPVVHGRWKYFNKQGIAVCTNCSFERKLDDDFGKAVSYPNYGAKMD